MRLQIRLDTMGDIRKFVNTVTAIDSRVTLEDDEGHKVSAKSLLGAIYTMEWSRVYCMCEKDISGMLLEWII